MEPENGMAQENPQAQGTAQQQDNPAAQQVASKGEGGDTVVAHLTRGEMIIPVEIMDANPDLQKAVFDAFRRVGGDPEQFVVGSPKQNINPETGIPEFSWWTSIRNTVEKGIGAGIGFAVGGPPGAAIGSALVGGVQGDRGLNLVADAAGGYFGGGTAFDIGSGVVNSGSLALGGAGSYGTGATLGSLASGAVSSVKDGLGGIGNFLSGAPTNITSNVAANASPGLLTSGGATTGAGTAATAGYGSDIMTALKSAPSWLAPTASLASAGLQYQGTEDAIGTEKKALASQTALQKPYTDAGASAAGQYSSLVSSPQAQTDFVANNGFYKTLANDAQSRLLSNQAAKGKTGSGETAKKLQEQLLTLGNGLVGDQLNRLNVQTQTGANAAANVGGAIGNVGTNVASLQAQGKEALGSGVVGASNAMTSNYQNNINTLLALQRLRMNPNQAYQPQQISL